MLIISGKDNQNNKEKQRKKEQGEQKLQKKGENKWFCWEFQLGFFQLICKAPVILKWNLELALSIILKERELYESKYVAVECRSLKIWDLLYFLIYSLILVLKWQQLLPI